MINFEFKGIRIGATTDLRQIDYRDARHNPKTRFEKSVEIFVQFWDFTIFNDNLYDLAFIKSTLQYFMQSYWKRSNKAGGKIVLSKALHQDHPFSGQQSLMFVARQKNNLHYLHVCLQTAGSDTILKEVYLDGQEVLMLEIALNKVINLLSPMPIHR